MDQSELTDAEREFDHVLDRLVLGDESALSDLDSDMFALGTWVLTGGQGYHQAPEGDQQAEANHGQQATIMVEPDPAAIGEGSDDQRDRGQMGAPAPDALEAAGSDVIPTHKHAPPDHARDEEGEPETDQPSDPAMHGNHDPARGYRRQRVNSFSHPIQ